MNKHFYLMIDTETAGGFDSPLVYDLGMQVIDRHGNVYAEYNLVISDVFYGMPENMTDAEFFAMYSQLAAHFANEVTKYLYDVADEEKGE